MAFNENSRVKDLLYYALGCIHLTLKREEYKMEKTVFKVEGISCEHCVNAITKAVGALPGVANVTIDLAAKSVEVEHDPSQTALEKIKAEIEEQGYDVL
jgi:copper chaperone